MYQETKPTDNYQPLTIINPADKKNFSLGLFWEERKTQLPGNGKLIGCMSPFISLYRSCETPISKERLELIVPIALEFEKEFGSGILVADSLAYGMSIPKSDLDLVVLNSADLRKTEIKASHKFLLEMLTDSFPEVKIQVDGDYPPSHNPEEIESTICFLENNPQFSKQQESELFQEWFTGKENALSEFIPDVLLDGGLYFGPDIQPLMNRIETTTLTCPFLSEEIKTSQQYMVRYYFRFLQNRYLNRLKQSVTYQKLLPDKQQELLKNITTMEGHLRLFPGD
ncbi:hypothetical protein COT75_03825 [Candidatus Beckwithbacteria bacterium CG10_big_fil_rev_8_21_14_0_10_34_10]|uniref:Uncharacterized protein n=1 Tax=Candidatus Beckwithbacteria bacterium CG10_big_fil_rev_8_21_14_0_10_34_10 TaxID=1974495 RepID=A0A2H0W8S3_9BACT|nr:MAG: hypothetical protein COT75_03825 [Candidatus Beckwithbacteria bacterium CG10_big_fil_rev_8_21_14_0_10_34_10]